MSENKKLNVAVIGLGNMGRHHVRNYSEMPDIHLVAVCDPGLEKADQFASDYNCNAYTDLSTLLSSESLDAVTLASPTDTHYKSGKQILESGVHLLIEKPIATTIKEADDLIETAKAKGVILTVGHIERFNPAVLKLKQLIEEGVLGDIASIIIRRVGAFPSQIEDANVMIDLAVHDIDILNDFLGTLPDTVLGNKGAVLTGGRPDHAECFLTYGRISAFVQVNWISPVKVRECIVTGSKGYAVMNFIDQSISLVKSNYELESLENGETLPHFQLSDAEDIKIDKGEPLRAELDQFLNAVRGVAPLLVTAEQARDAVKIVLDI